MSAWQDHGEPIEYAALGRGVLGRLTAWAESYAGPCGHAGRQFARVGDLRSGCPGCTTALDGWNASRPCDVCGAVTDPDLAWSLPAEMTGGVHVFLAICKTCSRRELHDPESPEEDEMTCCDFCRFGLQGGHHLPRLHMGWFHRECLQAVAGQGALVASAGDAGIARSMRVNALRARITGRHGR